MSSPDGAVMAEDDDTPTITTATSTPTTIGTANTIASLKTKSNFIGESSCINIVDSEIASKSKQNLTSGSLDLIKDHETKNENEIQQQQQQQQKPDHGSNQSGSDSGLGLSSNDNSSSTIQAPAKTDQLRFNANKQIGRVFDGDGQTNADNNNNGSNRAGVDQTTDAIHIGKTSQQTGYGCAQVQSSIKKVNANGQQMNRLANHGLDKRLSANKQDPVQADVVVVVQQPDSRRTLGDCNENITIDRGESQQPNLALLTNSSSERQQRPHHHNHQQQQQQHNLKDNNNNSHLKDTASKSEHHESHVSTLLLKSLLKKNTTDRCSKADNSNRKNNNNNNGRTKTVTFNQTVIVFCEEVDTLSMPVAFTDEIDHVENVDHYIENDDQENIEFDLSNLDQDNVRNNNTRTNIKGGSALDIEKQQRYDRVSNISVRERLLRQILAATGDSSPMSRLKYAQFDQDCDDISDEDDLPPKFYESNEGYLCNEAISDYDSDSESSLAIFDLKQRSKESTVTVDHSSKPLAPTRSTSDFNNNNNLLKEDHSKAKSARLKVSTVPEMSNSSTQASQQQPAIIGKSRPANISSSKASSLNRKELDNIGGYTIIVKQPTATSDINTPDITTLETTKEVPIHPRQLSYHNNHDQKLIHQQQQHLQQHMANQVDPISLSKANILHPLNSSIVDSKLSSQSMISRTISDLIKLPADRESNAINRSINQNTSRPIKDITNNKSQGIVCDDNQTRNDVSSSVNRVARIQRNTQPTTVGNSISQRTNDGLGPVQQVSCHLCKALLESTMRDELSQKPIIGLQQQELHKQQHQSNIVPDNMCNQIKLIRPNASGANINIIQQPYLTSCVSCKQDTIGSNKSQQNQQNIPANSTQDGLQGQSTQSESNVARSLPAYQLVYAINQNGDRVRALSYIGSAPVTDQGNVVGLNRVLYQGRGIILARPADIRVQQDTVAGLGMTNGQAQGAIPRNISNNNIANNIRYPAVSTSQSFIAQAVSVPQFSKINARYSDEQQKQQPTSENLTIKPKVTVPLRQHTVYYLRQPLNVASVGQACELVDRNTSSSSFPQPHQVRLLDGLKAPPTLNSTLQMNHSHVINSNRGQVFSNQTTMIQQPHRGSCISRTLEDIDDPSFGFSQRPMVKVVATNATTSIGNMTQSKSDVTMGLSNSVLRPKMNFNKTDVAIKPTIQ